ncbi:MAG: carcinine hydrolase/isopenicillin-N N-acyltransferase family protein [Neisseriaceae bacterium]
MKKIIIGLLCSFNFAIACTSFGAITESGSIIGKNRDFMYSKQTFELIEPLRQFVAWYGNSYNHQNQFYALMAGNDVKFGVNKYGLTAIEEDPPFPQGTYSQRRYMQPYTGYAEGMILYGILQNFATVDEIIPYINRIFSTAAPNYYQIADAHKILTVEVAYGNSDNDPVRKYVYRILKKRGDYFAHTNTYLEPQFESLNNMSTNKYGIAGSNNRLNKIGQYIKAANGNFNNAFSWYLDTRSDVRNPNDKDFCENTSIFRSNLQNLTSIRSDTKTNKVYGTVSSFMVEHKGNEAIVHVRILNSIDKLKNGNQKITYKELNTPLSKLFASNQLEYSSHTFIRSSPTNGKCK